jgi:hypothetical protein
MTSTPSVRRGALDLGDPEAIGELRDVLRAAGFDGEGVRSALGAESALLSRLADVPVHERRLRGVEPLGTLIRLFVLDAPATADDARRVLAPLTLDRLEQLGVLERGGGEVRARMRIVPHDDV